MMMCVCVWWRHTYHKETHSSFSSRWLICIEVNAEETNHMGMSRDQQAGQNRNINIGNKSFEKAEKLGHLGTTLTNQNCIQEEVKSRLKSGNACYHSVQNILS